jgi:hypothetical protein
MRLLARGITATSQFNHAEDEMNHDFDLGTKTTRLAIEKATGQEIHVPLSSDKMLRTHR